MSTKDALINLDSIQKRYESGESLFSLSREYKANWADLKKALISRNVKIRTKTEALQKYVKYSKCIICGKKFRVRPKWNDTSSHYKQTCGDPNCLFKLHSLKSKEKWNENRKEYMSKLFTGRDTTSWKIPRKEQKSNWKGGKTSVAYRKIAFEDYGLEKKCMQCGSTKNIDVHHKDKNRKNNKLENLLVMCHKCHIKYHDKKGDVGWSIYNKRYIPKISVEELTRELNSKCSIRSICKRYHTDHHTVSTMMKKYNIVKPKKELPDITAEQIKQHLLEGKSVRWMNREYNIRSNTVIPDIIKTNNIVVQTRKYMKNKPKTQKTLS
jgi:hypothetical protein